MAIKCGLSKKLPQQYHKYEPQSMWENTHYKTYYDRSSTTDQSICNNRPDIVILDKTKKEAHLRGMSNSQQSWPSLHHHQEAPEVYRLERRDYKNMATENGLYDTISTIHNEYYSKQITRKFKTT